MADPTSAGSQPQQATQPPTSDPSQQPSSSSNTAGESSSDTLTMNQEQDLDAEINPTPPPPAEGMNLDGAADMPSTATATQTQTQPSQQQPSQADQQPLQPNGIHPPQAVLEPRIPQKKDASLREFLGKMDDQYTPLIPDSVTDYYLTLAGLPPPPQTDRRLARLLALATQKFVADVAADAYQYSRIRSTNTTSNNPLTGLGGAAGFGTMEEGKGAGGGGGKKDASGGKSAPLGGPRAGYGGGGAGSAQGRTVLTMEDLGMAVGEYGVNVKRGEFYR